MVVNVLLFGPPADAAGTRVVPVDVGDPGTIAAASCASVLAALGRAKPALLPMLTHARLAVNQSLANPDQAVGPDDEVALIAMVSGG
jgi:molybdopterin converting factor small subunit